MQKVETKPVKEKLANRMLKFSQGLYRSRYFLVWKKNPGKYQFINDVQLLNGVMIHDSGILPCIDEFSEDFAGYPITSSADYYSGFN